MMTSFIFTSLEGARIEAMRARFVLLSEMASDSFSGEYYYPLFKEYSLLAVDGGFGKKETDRGRVEKELQGFLSYPYENSSDTLFGGTDPKVKLDSIGTILESEKSGIRHQIRDAALFEGAELLLDGIMGNDMFKAAGTLGKVYDKQAAAMEKVAAVTKELLRLMTLIDGVRTTENGLYTEEGKMRIAPSFVKKFGIKGESYMKGTYGAQFVFEEVKPTIVYGDTTIKLTLDMMGEVEGLDCDIEECEAEIAEMRDLLSSMEEERKGIVEEIKTLKEPPPAIDGEEKEKLTEEERKERIAALQGLSEKLKKSIEETKTLIDAENESRENLIKERKQRFSTLCVRYDVVAKVLRGCEEDAREALACVTELLVKQEMAKGVIDEYEDFIKKAGDIPGEILDSLLKDTVNIRSYASLDGSGYDAEGMMKEIFADLALFSAMQLPKDATGDMSRMRIALKKAQGFIEDLSYNKLKFNYTGVGTSKEIGKNVKETLGQLVSGGFLKYLGVTDVSPKKLNGLDLPSKGDFDKSSEDIFSSFTKMGDFFKNADPGTLLNEAGAKLTSDFVTEVWLANHFSNFREQKEDTMLSYEREYVLAGKRSDAENLASVVLKLTAFRAIFTLTSLIADPQRNAEATALAGSITGCIGFPELIYVVKYTILTVWALEEALVEVSGLLMGKKVPIYSPTGRVSVAEILIMTGDRVKTKASAIAGNAPGVSYMQYVTVLSFFENLGKKELRIADVIQENIRLKYRDSFRMSNAITDWSFTSSLIGSRKFDTGFYSDRAYGFNTKVTGGY
ncbi:MAG: DUF5702 domain-containing protein [Lachnospiraceae bacterium]|nr:DUF5702 domain-containing protein [Lachnospiraceae bacterium]